jgi:hypothetical protein
MLDIEILEKAKEWLQKEIVGTRYEYQLPAGAPQLFSDTKLGSEHFTVPVKLKGWRTVHEIEFLSCGIDIKRKDYARVCIEADLLKSEGNEDEGEGESYKERATYFLLVPKDCEVDFWVERRCIFFGQFV